MICVQLTFTPNLCITLSEMVLISISGDLRILLGILRVLSLVPPPRPHVTGVKTNMSTGIDGAISLLESDIGNGTLYFRFPGDGNCLVNSVLTGLRDLGRVIEMWDILDTIAKDTIDDARVYITHLDTLSLDVLIWNMKCVIIGSITNVFFCDLVPYKFANSLQINIIIIPKANR